jgi:hypothetical protein
MWIAVRFRQSLVDRPGRCGLISTSPTDLHHCPQSREPGPSSWYRDTAFTTWAPHVSYASQHSLDYGRDGHDVEGACDDGCIGDDSIYLENEGKLNGSALSNRILLFEVLPTPTSF